MTTSHTRPTTRTLEAYAALPDIDQALRRTASLADSIFALLDEVRLTVQDSEVLDSIGLYVLHRHWDMEEVTKPLTEEYDATADRIVATHRRFEEGRHHPCKWRFLEGDSAVPILPLEWSADASVARTSRLLNDAREEVAKIRDLTFQAELQEVVGLAVLQRSWLPLSGHNFYLENSADGVSSVEVVPATTRRADEVPTVYDFNALPTAGCKFDWVCRWENGEHKQSWEHVLTPDDD